MPASNRKFLQAPNQQAWLEWFRWPPFRAILIALLVQGAMTWWTSYWNASAIVGPNAPFWKFPSLNVPLDQVTVWLSLPISLATPLLVVAVPALMVSRLRSQMTDWRAALMPRFKQAALLSGMALSAVLFLVAVIGPMLAEMRMHAYPLTEMRQVREALRGPLGMLGREVFAMSLAGWIAAWGSPWLALLLPLGYWGLLWLAEPIGAGAAGHAALDVLFGSSRDGLVVVSSWFALDAFMLASLLIRLMNLTPASEQRTTAAGTISLEAVLGGFHSIAPGDLAAASIFKRVAHRRMIGVGRRFALFMAAYLGLLITLSPILSHLPTDYNGWVTDRDFAFAALVIAGITPVLLVGLLWPRRMVQLGAVEMLRPVSRERFVGEIALAMASDMAEISLAAIGTAIIPIAVWSPFLVVDPSLWMAVAAGILSQFLAFGLVIAAMRVGSSPVSAAAVGLALGVTAVVINLALDGRGIEPAIVAAVVGAIVIAAAYWQWLRGEIA